MYDSFYKMRFKNDSNNKLKKIFKTLASMRYRLGSHRSLI